jgi:hypothetical protein
MLKVVHISTQSKNGRNTISDLNYSYRFRFSKISKIKNFSTYGEGSKNVPTGFIMQKNSKRDSIT